MDHQVEAVARAFYEAEDDGKAWECEPDILKEEFRRLARCAIALLPEQEDDVQAPALEDLRYAA